MKLRFEQHVAIDREMLFRFHDTPANLVLLMEQWPAFRLLQHEGTIRCGAKLRVAERMGLFWIPMTFEHFVYEPPFRFGERQINGPFKKCEHIHEFVEESGGTQIIDHLDVSLPWWLGGESVTRWFAARRLRRMFEYRRRSYQSLLLSGRIAGGTP